MVVYYGCTKRQRGIKIMGGIVFIAGLGVVMTMLMSLK